MSNNPASYSERLWPSPVLIATLLLLVPSVTLVITPLQASIALPVAIAVYVLVVTALVMMSPTIKIEERSLLAGRAKIDLAHIGEATKLGQTGLRRVLGPEADARAYLVIRGYIHQGVKLEIVDPNDPTPYWILTSRKPDELIAAIQTAR